MFDILVWGYFLCEFSVCVGVLGLQFGLEFGSCVWVFTFIWGYFLWWCLSFVGSLHCAGLYNFCVSQLIFVPVLVPNLMLCFHVICVPLFNV